MSHTKLLFIILICCFTFSCKNDASIINQTNATTHHQSATGTNGMVVSAHPLASKIGIDVLKMGGNAIDACIAVQFALAVVYPRAGNLGGGGFAIIHTKDGQQSALDFREKAPIQATKNMYLDTQGDIIPRLSVDGHLAVGVPGMVDGLYELKEKYGSKIPMESLLQPAITLAKEGFLITEPEAKRLNKYQSDFVKFNDSDCVFIKDQWQAKDRLKQEDLAACLTRIKQQGKAGFYQGQTAEYLLREIKSNNGIISQEDLDKYQSVWREPIIFDYKEHQISSMPLPSSGGVVLAQMLQMLETVETKAQVFHSVEYLHLLAEIEKRAYADRADYLGDLDFVDVPLNKLMSEEYLSQKIMDFHPDSVKPIDKIFENIAFEDLESYETTHISVIDKEGNGVAMTVTLNGNYGSKVVVDGAGFFLNNEMDDFSAKPGTPNIYGLIGSEANAIASEKRMLSSMSPTIVTDKKGEVKLILGSPGGSTIITSVLQVILNVLDHQMTIDEAINQPRFHHQGIPNQVLIEKDKFSDSLITALENKGHKIKTTERIGVVKAIENKQGVYYGSGDYRNPDDCSIGY